MLILDLMPNKSYKRDTDFQDMKSGREKMEAQQ